MKRFRMLLIASALMAGGTALASAQPYDHDGRFRDHRVVREERGFVRRPVVVEHRYAVGERRFFNGYYWTWDGGRWCRRDGRVVLYFGF